MTIEYSVKFSIQTWRIAVVVFRKLEKPISIVFRLTRTRPESTTNMAAGGAARLALDREQRLVIGVDYGTTSTGNGVILIRFLFLEYLLLTLLGLAVATPVGRTCTLGDIQCIAAWHTGMSNTDKVPSRIAYSIGPDGKENGVHEWGAAIKSDQIRMVHTKLELDPGTVLETLESILNLLDGVDNLHFKTIKATESAGNPPYTRKTAEEIVTDYLTQVVQCAEQKVDILDPNGSARRLISTDIVITVPTVRIPPHFVSILRLTCL